MLSFDRCYLEVMEYPRADRATIVWTDDGRREIVECGEEAYALAYEAADLERAVAGSEEERKLITYASECDGCYDAPAATTGACITPKRPR